MFSNIFERFQTFLNVFALPILPNRYNLTPQSPFLTQKPTHPTKKTQKTPFFLRFRIISITLGNRPELLFMRLKSTIGAVNQQLCLQ